MQRVTYNASACQRGASGPDPLFQALREWRTEEARRKAIPPYIVFHDSTLRAIATARPLTEEALATVSGIGAVKLATYGEAVLAVVRAHSVG